jgi:hypothetical protein
MWYLICTKEDIIGAVNELRNGKPAGPDDILHEFVKHAYDILVPYLGVVFNQMFDDGVFPKAWALIVPLHKSGATDIPGHYRGISLLSLFVKLFASILNKRKTVWWDSYNIHSEE